MKRSRDIDALETSTSVSDQQISKAIEAALNGEILEDAELDSDELVPSSEDSESEDPDQDDLFASSESEDNDSLFTVVEGADGNERRMYPEIQPGYESDSSTEDTTAPGANTVGNIDLSLYDKMPHMGYDVNGKRVMRPAVGKALDTLLETMEGSEGYTGVMDPNTGLPMKLTSDELDIIKRIKRAELPDAEYNAYEDYVDYFSGVLEESPISQRPEPKSRFVPSKHEQKRVVKIVRAIREGRIVTKKPPSADTKTHQRYDVWQNEVPVPDHVMNMPAPKMNLPTHAESYNPPAEYLPTPEEAEAWLQQDPEDRERDFLPQKYSSLRLVPGYAQVLKERFERCLDLYLAPRMRRNKLNIDPESLVPKLPSPQDLRPFPTRCTNIMKGHKSRVRCIDVTPDGNWLASGSDDGTVKIWEVYTGRCIKTINRFDGETVFACKWSPRTDVAILLVSAGDYVYLISPSIFSEEVEDATREVCNAGFSYEAPSDGRRPSTCRWEKATPKQSEQGILLTIHCKKAMKQVDWHRRGDYFSTTSPEGETSTVYVHQLSKHSSQSPFSSKAKHGSVQAVLFHPSKPYLYVASQRNIRIYNLQKQELVRAMQSGLRWISSMSIHPGGDNFIVGSYDKKLAWFDTDLSARPYRTLKYHTKAVRSVSYHPRLPLFCSSSDDGTTQVFHGTVYSDLNTNALIVPLKILKGHGVVDSLGVLANVWHPRQPWLMSAGADHTIRLFT